MNLLHVFGENVRHYREVLGVSQEKFAEMCGLHRTYISDLERFQRNISINNIEKIAEALGVEAYILFQTSEDKKPVPGNLMCSSQID
ncbi:MAG: helix-turn-helix transcriptional regulator [Bacillota bacterium]|nr:helix-turn-helix transcriptional regulator [Bacillota bacterium]